MSSYEENVSMIVVVEVQAEFPFQVLLDLFKLLVVTGLKNIVVSTSFWMFCLKCGLWNAFAVFAYFRKIIIEQICICVKNVGAQTHFSALPVRLLGNRKIPLCFCGLCLQFFLINHFCFFLLSIFLIKMFLQFMFNFSFCSPIFCKKLSLLILFVCSVFKLVINPKSLVFTCPFLFLKDRFIQNVKKHCVKMMEALFAA